MKIAIRIEDHEWSSAKHTPPEVGKRLLVKIKHHSCISDYDSKRISDSEKVFHAEYSEICEAVYTGKGKYVYLDLEIGLDRGTAYADPKEDKSYPIDEVVEWVYMPSLQPDTCKYTGGACCYPIDECEECPNNPEHSDGES